MPLMRYFMYVGGALLALLLIANICLPAPPVPQKSQSATDLSVVRIHSDQKWPERVVFDTTRPTITPARAAGAAEAPQPPQPKVAAAEPAKGHVREAYAQMRPNPSEPRSAEPKRKRRAVAKNYNYNNYYGQQRIIVAQQRPVYFFGNNIW
jgi:hypothetical protein